MHYIFTWGKVDNALQGGEHMVYCRNYHGLKRGSHGSKPSNKPGNKKNHLQNKL